MSAVNPSVIMVVGDQTLQFGIPSDEASLVTQKVSVTNKSDKKEARDKGGKVIAVAYYNTTSDITIDGLAGLAYTRAIASSLSLTSPPIALAGAAFVDEVSAEAGNEDFKTISIKATAYEGISA